MSCTAVEQTEVVLEAAEKQDPPSFVNPNGEMKIVSGFSQSKH